MRCFYVLVRGSLEWECEPEIDEDSFRPAGFHCHRYVLASGFEEAAEKAFRRVRKNFEKQTGWLGRGLVKLTLDAEELTPAPIRKLLRRDNRGHSFYATDVAADA
ncbi:MAG: hypothetical protein ACJ8FC_12405 [Sphingomicrobium sp.]